MLFSPLPFGIWTAVFYDWAGREWYLLKPLLYWEGFFARMIKESFFPPWHDAVLWRNQILLERSIPLCLLPLQCAGKASRQIEISLQPHIEKEIGKSLELRLMWFSLSCLLVKALRRTCVVLGMRSWIEGLGLFCVKFEICFRFLLYFPIFDLPHSTAIDFIHMAFSWLFMKSLIRMYVIAKELSCCSVFSWSAEVGE